MTIHLKDCPPALRARIEAALALEPKRYFAMATFLKGQWTIGPITTDESLVNGLVAKFNVSSPTLAAKFLAGQPAAVTVEIN